MASAEIVFGGQPLVALSDFEIVAWEKTKVIAQRDETWQLTNCATEQLVLDFPSNTVTLTSTWNRSGDCGKRLEAADKLATNKAPLKDAEVFTLVHNSGALHADEGMNPFFHVTK
jgi:hypothetical protein